MNEHRHIYDIPAVIRGDGPWDEEARIVVRVDLSAVMRPLLERIDTLMEASGDLQQQVTALGQQVSDLASTAKAAQDRVQKDWDSLHAQITDLENAHNVDLSPIRDGLNSIKDAVDSIDAPATPPAPPAPAPDQPPAPAPDQPPVL